MQKVLCVVVNVARRCNKKYPNETKLTFPEREPSLRGMLDKICHSLPDTSFNRRQLESGSRIIIVQIRADEIS